MTPPPEVLPPHLESRPRRMGHLHYNSEPFLFEDRTLAHVQLVVGLKLRRGEHFFLSWKSGTELGGGRHALWIDNGVPMHFEYQGGRAPGINREWVEQLITASNSSIGLNLADEHNQESAPARIPPDNSRRQRPTASH